MTPRRPLSWVSPAEQSSRLAAPTFWDDIEAREARRIGSGTWELEGLGITLEMRGAKERAKRETEARDRIAAAERERRREGRQATPHDRASAYLSGMDVGAGQAWQAVLRAVRGFALGAEEGAALVMRDFAPRYHRKLRPGEVRDMARRAMRATVPWGWLLTAERR